MESFIFWDQNVFMHNLRYKEKDQTFAWRSGTQYWDLVISFLNHEYDLIADDNGVFPYGLMEEATAHSHNVSVKERLVKEIESDLAEIDYHTVHDIIGKVFLDTTFPELSASQKYYALVEAHRCMENGTAPLEKLIRSAATMRVRYELADAMLTPALTMSIPDSHDGMSHSIDKLFALACEDLMERPEDDKMVYYGYSTVFSSLHDTVIYLLHEMIKKNCVVKKCPNCNRYFVPLKRADTIYCTHPSPETPNKTCQEYMKYRKSLEKSQTDEATRVYRQIYNSKNNKLRRCGGKNTALHGDLNTFVSSASQWKMDVKNGARTKDEYLSWLYAMKEPKLQ